MHGTTAVVTGGATSLGYAIAEQFAEQGGNVVVGDVDADEGERAAERLTDDTGGDAQFVRTDVSDEDDCRAMVAAAADRYGGVDVLVNNAGVRDVIAVDDVTREDWERHVEVNLSGAFYCCQAALPYLRESDRARIVNVSSGTARQGHPVGAAPYVSAKAGVLGLTRTLARELGADGVSVNAVVPSVIQGSGMQEGRDQAYLDRMTDETPLGRLPTSADVAFAVLCLAAERGGMISGQAIDVNGGRDMR